MENAIFYGIIGGVFSLIFIYLESRMETKSKSLFHFETQDRNQDFDSKSLKSKNDIGKGLLILFLDMILIITVVSIFDLNEQNFVWEDLFSIIALGVIPTYAIFKILRGWFRWVVN